LLSSLAADAKAAGTIPVVHLECRGSRERLTFADNASATWAELKDPLTALNVATKLNLLVVASDCDGRGLISTVSSSDQAPFYGFIGPDRAVSSAERMRACMALYETLLKRRSVRQAMDAMHAATPDTFVHRSAEWVFQHVWGHFQATYHAPEARQEWGRRVAPLFPADDGGPPISQAFVAQLLADKNREFFEQFRNTFFLCDLYPEHETRFPVRYEPS
jgi:hypothetical protein